MPIVFTLWFRLLPDKRYKATAIWPFIFIKYKSLKDDNVLMNHERIHLRQQLELLVLPFYLIYFLEYCYYRFKGKDHDGAYRQISFEREAFKNDSDLEYLKRRKAWSGFR